MCCGLNVWELCLKHMVLLILGEAFFEAQPSLNLACHVPSRNQVSSLQNLLKTHPLLGHEGGPLDFPTSCKGVWWRRFGREGKKGDVQLPGLLKKSS